MPGSIRASISKRGTSDAALTPISGSPPLASTPSSATGAGFTLSGFSCFASSLRSCAEFIANDKPILVSYKGEWLFPAFVDYPEDKFGGFLAQTDYRDPVIFKEIEANGWMIWPPIRYSYDTHQSRGRRCPPPRRRPGA